MPTNCARSRAISGNFSNCNCFGRQISVLSMPHSISAAPGSGLLILTSIKSGDCPSVETSMKARSKFSCNARKPLLMYSSKSVQTKSKENLLFYSLAFRVHAVDEIYLLPLSRTHYPRKCAPYRNYYCECVSCSLIGRSACPCRIWWRNRDFACASGKIDVAHPHCRTVGFLCNCEYPEAQKKWWEKKNVKIYSCHQSRANTMVVVLNDEFLTLFTEISSKLNRKQTWKISQRLHTLCSVW